MKMSKNKMKPADSINSNHGESSLISALKTKEGTFYNLINNMFDAIESLGSIKTPIVTMTCRKNFLSYNFDFDIVYVTLDGTPYRKNKFYSDSLFGGMVGLIPQYIVDAVKQNGIAEICFNADDLEILFNELNIEIVEIKKWSDLERECIVNVCTCIKLIDRVFYTRVECYDVNKKQIDVTHVASIKNLPMTISSKLYPVGNAEYVLQY